MENKANYITLGQFLKLNDFVSSGGEAKHRIHEFDITINGKKDNRRGRKLYAGDVIKINDEVFELAISDEN